MELQPATGTAPPPESVGSTQGDCPEVKRFGESPRIAYSESGDGPLLIFLHGIGGSRLNWNVQVEHFKTRFRTVAWDARGYGDSDDYDGPCRFQDFSRDLLNLLRHLGEASAHFVGLSMGGRILMDFVDTHPHCVKSLVLAGSFPSFGKALSEEQQRDFMERRRAPLNAGATMSDLADGLLGSLLGPEAPEAARVEARRSIIALRSDSYLKVLEATLTFDKTEALARTQVPVLLLVGELDALVTPKLGEEVLRLVPHAKMSVIPRSGHLLNLEAPELFNKQVDCFLNDVEGAALR